MSLWILILIEHGKVGIFALIVLIISLTSSGLSIKYAPIPSFIAHFCGHPQLTSKKVRLLLISDNKIFLIQFIYLFHQRD